MMYSIVVNVEKHSRNCICGATPAKRQCVSVAVPVSVPVAGPGFVLRATRRSLGSIVKQFTVNMKAVSNLSSLEVAMTVFTPAMLTFQQKHHAYKSQCAVDIMFHKAVDTSVVTQPPVTLTSEMLAVYSDSSPPLDDVHRQLLNFIEVYEHNGSVWVFSYFTSLR